MNKGFCSVIFLMLTIVHESLCISLVYNLRISETTRRRLTSIQYGPYNMAFTGVEQMRTRYDNVDQKLGALIYTFLYTYKNLYAKVDFAAGKVSENTLSAFGPFHHKHTDDILLTTGYRCIHKSKGSLTVSGLFGIPTHQDYFLYGFQLGTGHLGLGGQIDGSYIYAKNSHMIIGATRFVHFFSRYVCAPLPPAPQLLDVHPGNLVDIFIAHRSRYKRHSFECGYNPGFIFGSFVLPRLPALNDLKVIRSSWYATYGCGMKMRKILGAFLFGASYSFDHKPKTIGIKRAITVWSTFGFNF